MLAPVAGVDAERAAFQVELPNLMKARHGDVERIARFGDVPGRAERDESRVAAGVEAARLLARPRDSADFERFEVDGADCVVLGVGDVEDGPIERAALRVVEGGFVGAPVLQPPFAAADERLDAPAEVRPHDAVVV